MKSTMMNRFLMMMIALLCVGAETMKADETTYIKSVVNGTTLVTEQGDTVKLIGVRAWNTESMSEKDLQDYLEILVGGVKVNLTEDPAISSQAGTRFCYVEVGGTLVNQHVIAEGYAQAATAMSFSKQMSFTAAERVAKMERVGRWAIEDQYAGVAVATINENMTAAGTISVPQSVDQIISGLVK